MQARCEQKALSSGRPRWHHGLMQRVVMDTNALVAARWKPDGAAARLMSLCADGRCRALVSHEVILENLRIIQKVKPSPAFWTRVHLFHASAELVTDLPDVHVEQDPADSAFLACALGGRADYLVSTDRHLRVYDGQDGLRIGPASRVFGDHPELEAPPPPLPDSGNLLARLPDAARGEMFETLAASAYVRVERIVSRGQASPPDAWYDQAENEWVVVIKGRAGLEIEGRDGEQVLAAGDYVHLPAHARHRVTWTQAGHETVWLAVRYGEVMRGEL